MASESAASAAAACSSSSTSSWQQLPNLQHQHVFPALATAGDGIVLIGGCSQTGQPISDCEWLLMDSDCKSWTDAPALPSARAGVQACTLDNSVYCFGGSGPNQSGVESIDKFDPGSMTWQSVGKLPTPIKSCAVAARSGKFFIAGGMQSSAVTHKDFYCFDPVSGKLAALPNMNHSRYSPGCFLDEDTLYLLGGREGRNPLGSCEAFDFRACKWRELPDLPQHSRVFPIFCRFGRRVLCCGGLDPQNLASGFSVACHCFSFDNEQWSECADLLIGRADAASAVAPDGGVFIAAGMDNNGKPSESCHRYDAVANAWSEHSSLGSSHMSCGFVQQNGRLIVAAGIGNTGVSQSVRALVL